jgi:glucuronokinase
MAPYACTLICAWNSTHFVEHRLTQAYPVVEETICARIGIMGNPSDGFEGKTLAMTIHNFHATVTLRESKRLALVPHPQFDRNEFDGLQQLLYLTGMLWFPSGCI